MNDGLNPYAAPQSDLTAACEPIPFAGEITREDLPALLPTFLLRRLLFVLSLLIVLPFAAVPAASVAVGIHTGSEVLGMALWVLFLVVFISIALWLSRRQRRADLLVAQNPSCIGEISGALTPHGFERVDPNQLTRIPWSKFSAVHVWKAGIRLQLGGKARDFVFLPAHCFAGYEHRRMRVAVAALQSSELDGTHQASEVSLLDPSWRNAPADAIYFDGVVSMESQGSTLWRLWPTVLLAAVTASGILLLVTTMIRGWYTAAVVLVGALLIASGYLENQLRAWWSTHRQPTSWRQHGWVAEHRIYSVMAGKEYYDNWQVVAGVSHDSENLTITWRDHSELRISRQHLVDPEQWSSLLHLADAEKGVGHLFGELG